MLSAAERERLSSGHAGSERNSLRGACFGLAIVIGIATAAAFSAGNDAALRAEEEQRLAVEQAAMAHARDLFRQRQLLVSTVQ